MKLGKVVFHVAFVMCLLFLTAVLPIITHFDLFGAFDTDAVSSASIELPDQPSGEFIVLINKEKHSNTTEDWRVFFSGEDLPVIFEDISCLTATGDTSGQQLAERYQLQLPENQMKLDEENGVLLASKVESGYIDVAIFSSEMADALKLAPDEEEVTAFTVYGGEQ